ncbi:MAG: retropepsin-like aspartic protease [bacterium]|nr:retropepsin-like aspartic protease [bacterium]
MVIKETLPIQLVEIEPGNYHPFIFAKIGRQKVRLLLDTGASKTAFDQEQILKFVSEETLRSYEIQSVGLGSNTVLTQLSHLPKIKFGSIELQQQEVAVLNLSHVNQAYEMLNLKKIDGVLGSDILYALKAIINYPKAQLSLSQKR